MATLTTTVQESVTINGKLYGNTITKTHSSIDQVYQQVVTVGTSIQEIIGFAGTEKAGELADGKLKYLRITNTGSNFIEVFFDIAGSGNDTASFKVEAGCSMVITHDQVGFGAAAASTSLSQLDAIHGKADTAAVAVELFFGLTA
tara:strand:+ start:394 stop:828 length:435 start_codon:yes stop_codon:yes gene_type:complete